MIAEALKLKLRNSRTWWTIHHWVGLKLSILLSFIMLTGTLSVWGHEIDWILNPDIRVDHASIEGEVNWTAIADSVAEYAPGSRIDVVDAPIARGFAATAEIILSDQSRRRVYVHPTTGEIQGEASGLNAQGILRWVHRSLLLPGKLGSVFVPSMSIFLATSLVTALVVHKKWWRGFFRPLRTRTARTWVGDFHRLIGVWTLWFALLVVLSGFWYTAEIVGAGAPAKPRYWKRGIEFSVEQSAAALPTMFQAAQHAYPDFQFERIIFPTERWGSFRFEGQYKAALVRKRANVVWVDAETASVELFADGRDLSVHQRISEMADPVHFGTFGGVWTKIIWFIFGVCLTSMSISGAVIYSLRLLKSERKPASVKSVTAAYIRGVGLFVWPTAGLVILCFVLLARAMF